MFHFLLLLEAKSGQHVHKFSQSLFCSELFLQHTVMVLQKQGVSLSPPPPPIDDVKEN